MDITGMLLKKSEVKNLTENFSVQEFYLDTSTYHPYTGEKFDNIIKLQVSNNKIASLMPIQPGQRIKVSFSPRGRFYEKDGEKRHIQNLDAWKIELQDTQGSLTKEPDFTPEPITNEDDDDDLPF